MAIKRWLLCVVVLLFYWICINDFYFVLFCLWFSLTGQLFHCYCRLAWELLDFLQQVFTGMVSFLSTSSGVRALKGKYTSLAEMYFISFRTFSHIIYAIHLWLLRRWQRNSCGYDLMLFTRSKSGVLTLGVNRVTSEAFWVVQLRFCLGSNNTQYRLFQTCLFARY